MKTKALDICFTYKINARATLVVSVLCIQVKLTDKQTITVTFAVTAAVFGEGIKSAPSEGRGTKRL